MIDTVKGVSRYLSSNEKGMKWNNKRVAWTILHQTEL